MTWPTKDDFVDGDVLTAAQVNNIADNLNLFDPTSATNGQVLTANGAGSAAYQTLSVGGMTVISSGSLPATNALSLTSIPSTYNNLQLSLFNFRPSTADELMLRINNLSANNYGWVEDVGQLNTVAAQGANNQTQVSLDGLYSTAAANAVIHLYLWDYKTNARQVGMFQGLLFDGTNLRTIDNVWRYADAVEVNRIDLYWANAAYTFNGGTYILYGVK